MGIFKKKEEYNRRFKTGLKIRGHIQKLAKDIVENKITPKSFENLSDPYIQTLKEYYRDNFLSWK